MALISVQPTLDFDDNTDMPKQRYAPWRGNAIPAVGINREKAMQERRRRHRKHPADMLWIVDRGSKHVIGSLGNVTLEGIMVATGEPLNVNTGYSLKIICPGMLNGRAYPDFEAENLQRIQHQMGPEYQTGLKLTNRVPEVQPAIELPMESHRFHILQRIGISELE